MKELRSRVEHIAADQHEVVAGWQLVERGWERAQVKAGMRGLRRVFRDVCATGDLTERGWFMAAALALGPTGAVSHESALMLTGLRPFREADIHVSYSGGHRDPRPGLIPHRRRPFDATRWAGIPTTIPTQALKDASLQPHELYRALEKAERMNLRIHLLNDVVRLKQAIRGYTRSDTEARFLWLLHEHGFPLPLVNHVLNGYETDFHWPELRLAVEVDGFEHHRERSQFNEDRHRGLVHEASGYHLIRVSADHVYDQPRLVIDALTQRR